MRQTALSIIIPVRNKWDLTNACLRSLRDHAPEGSFEVVVIDDDSTDETAERLEPFGRELFPDAFVRMRNEENRNFAGACNRGAQAARHDLLFFLNNDTLLTPGWDRPLINALAGDSQLGAVGPLLLYEDDTVQHCGISYAPQGLSHLYRTFPRDHPLMAAPRQSQFLTAAALLIPRDLFLAHGGFHEGYRNGFEDVDLCAHIGKGGKTFACVPESVICHLESRTRGGPAKTDNDALFFARCGGVMYIDAHLHALRDGLSFSINDLFGVSIHLPPDEEMRLAREADGLTLDGWMRLVRRNPLWLKGREVLAICFEDEGCIEDAGLLRMEMANILPTIEHYRQLLRLAATAGDPPWAAGAREGLETMVAHSKNGKLAMAKVAHIRERYRDGHDTLLENACRDKLREMGHGEIYERALQQ